MFGLVQESRLGELLVKHCEPHDWERGESNIVALIDDRLIHDLPTKGRCVAEPVLWHDEEIVFVKHEVGSKRVASIGFSTMIEDQGSQVLELGNSVVACPSSLHSLKTL